MSLICLQLGWATPDDWGRGVGGGLSLCENERERERGGGGGGDRTKIKLCFITLLYSSHLQVLLQYFHKSTCVTFIVYMIMHDSGHHRYSNNSACDLIYTTNLSCFNASCTHNTSSWKFRSRVSGNP